MFPSFISLYPLSFYRFTFLNPDGSDSDGKGGKGGKGGRASDGDDIKIHTMYISSSTGELTPGYSLQESSTKGRSYSSTDGKDANCTYSENQSKQIAQRDPAEAVNTFKSFVWDNLLDNIRRKDLLQLLQKLETHSRVKVLYDNDI